jgi:hypothetical protein
MAHIDHRLRKYLEYMYTYGNVTKLPVQLLYTNKNVKKNFCSVTKDKIGETEKASHVKCETKYLFW